MSSSYPGALDSLTNPSGSDAMNGANLHSAQHANANDAIDAIETTLGVNPQGSYTDVAERLDVLPDPVGATDGYVVTVDTDAYVLAAPTGGGGGHPSNDAVITGTTGSPTIDTSTVPGEAIYIWTGDGSVTVDTGGGWAELLVVGGGGGGGANHGGGGAPGALMRKRVWLDAGTHTVTIGAAGAAGVVAPGGPGGTSRIGPYQAPGGPGGGGRGLGPTGQPGISGSGAGGEDSVYAGGISTAPQIEAAVAFASGESFDHALGGPGAANSYQQGGQGGAPGTTPSASTSINTGPSDSITGSSVTYASGGGGGNGGGHGSADTAPGSGGYGGTGSVGSGGAGVAGIAILRVVL